jgi:DNA-binding NarL/FixJ family response regulator
MHALGSSEIVSDVASLEMPTLVLHPRDMRVLPAEESMKLAATAPDGRFVLTDGDFVFGDAGQSLEAIDSFLNSVLTAPVVSRQAADGTASERLSQREVEVLHLVAAGKSNAEIAEELVISINTVRRHVSNVFDKTGVANRTQAAAYAKDHGLA